jgi:hypothetical protein
MTAFSTIGRGKFSKRGNRKDGPRPRQPVISGFWGVAGFMPTRTPGEWRYAQGIINGPEFSVTEGDNQITVILDGGEVSEVFARNDQAEAKAWIDDQIFELMKMQADVDAPLDWQPAGAEIDIDDFMAGRWVRS